MSERRAIATKWTCQREGECCLGPELVCTPAEVAAMQTAQYVALDVQPHPSSRAHVVVKTPRGCPYLTRSLDGQAACAIYAARPFNCRRFMCLRPEPKTEAWEAGGPLGCRNLSERLDQSLHALTFYEANQRRAQTWARTHGWSR